MDFKAFLLTMLFLTGAHLHGANNFELEDKWYTCMIGLASPHADVSSYLLLIIEKTEKLIIKNPEVINYQAAGSDCTLLHRIIKCIYKYSNEPVILVSMQHLVTLLLERNVDLTLERSMYKTPSRTPLGLALAYSTSKNKESLGYNVLVIVIEKLKEAMKKRKIPIRDELPWTEEALSHLFLINEG